MKNILIAAAVLILFFGCSPAPDEQERDTAGRRFRTSQPSLLYFKNMRSTQYTMEEQAKSRIELYRHRKFEPTTQRPVLYPVIANNWLNDEAYLFLMPNEFEGQLAEPLTITQDTSSTEALRLESPKPGQQLELALQLFEGLKAGKNWFVRQQNGHYLPLYTDGDERAAYLTTVQDFLRLTDAE